ncbi:MAG: hypothetical protein DRQ88_05335 [Epsilonproteobacteria bacterium]|nr:MAG: hypothetical protein DRQ89_04420 [Campylobacterota bacterium]RLA66851.1 MAG: hypothetical protein DRQ88_05335 [Campylobacterota bacterium]
MSKILLLIALLSSEVFGADKEADFLIKKESQLLIHGESNVIDFTCMLKDAFDNTPFKMKGKEKRKKLYFNEGEIIVPTRNLDCGSRGMNQDMWEMLQQKKYPNIILDFIELQTPQWEKEEKSFSSSALSKIKITIAGIAREYPIHLNLVKIDEENYQLSGSKKLRMTDFKIEPKHYLFGLIRVKDLIEIDFQLFLTK